MPRTKAAYDLEEITPSHFIVHNNNAYSVLRGEGERRGTLFALTSWRREGLLARLAARGYRTLTLEGRIENLPPLPQPQPLGETGWRALGSSTERYSTFDPQTLEWHALEPVQRNAVAGVELRANQVVRRRKGRGAPEYYLALGERNGSIGLRPVDETAALLAGYAQRESDLGSIAARREGDTFAVPALPLPQPHREFLRRVAEEAPDGWRVNERGWPYAVRLFACLGLELALE